MAATSIIVDHGQYRIEYSRNPDFEQIRLDWDALASQHQPECFLAWNWISCWLKTYSPECLVVSAYHDDRLVAMGLFVECCERRHRFVVSRQLLLHQTGDPQLDQIWIEYNGFVSDPEHRMQAINACLNVLLREESWNEIVLSMMRRSDTEALNIDNARLRKVREAPCFAVDLAALRESGTNYLDSLSANSRYQIRRSTRLLESEYGELKLEPATSVTEALASFNEAGTLHRRRWADSGYKNSSFVEFHHNLIESSFDSGNVELYRVRAGASTLAILYNLVVDRRVYFYLQGVNYDIDPAARPGLVAQSLIISLYLEQGKDLYDLMGGFSQYKQQLAEPSESLISIVVQKPKLAFRVENLFRWAKYFVLPREDGLSQP